MSATVQAVVKIDVSPDGISLVIEGLDNNVSQLLQAAGGFTVQPIISETVDTSVVTIRSNQVLQFAPRP